MSFYEDEVGEDYAKYCVYRPPASYVPRYTADKRWYWYKTQDSEGNFKFEIGSFQEKKADGVVVLMPTDRFDPVEYHEEELDGTYSGLFLVALNPYLRLPIYTPGMIKHYAGKRREEREPHIFAVADEAYRNLLQTNSSQSIILTGESGAGKTENTEKIIQYLAAIAGTSTADGAHGQLEEQLIQANLLLEALGNAKTTKNDNSSRFGKFIKITFGKSTKISGASIVSYLLERSRVTHQEEGERNFHIFYQLIKCFPGKDALGLADTADYNYITDNSSSIVDSINEQCEFDATLAALSTLGFSTEEKDLIFAILAAILHLGNVTFKGCERSEVVDMTPVNKAGELLRIPPTEIARAICSPFRVRGTQRVQVDKSPLLASLSRDALCRALYGRLFLWIVHRINETLNVTNENFIGILDITGFENLKLNSFEQLCINYTNERLQQFFNNHMFCLEQEEYANEQIPWTRINFDKDSTETIDVIGKIFNSLEDICAATRRAANPDKDFTSKISNQFKGTKVVGDCEFVLEHYVGAVTYDTQGWVEKNRDTLEADLQTAFCASGSKTLASLFIDFTLNTDAMTDIERVMSAARGANVQSISSSYREQLGSLMNTLQATQPHFIRCIIPNDQKMPHTIDDALVVKQLNCNGVLEGIRISRLGYPNRMRYADFVKRYYIIDDESTKNLSDKRAATEKILLKCVGNGIIDPQRHAYGRTKILFRIRELANIEDERARVVGQIAVTIQALARGYAGRKSYRKLFEKYTAAGVICKSEKVDVSHSLIMAKLLDLEE